MNAKRIWQLIGLLLGLALGAAILAGRAGWVDDAVARAGIAQFAPSARPPLGQKAHIALALAAVVLGGLLGWIAGRVFGRTPRLGYGEIAGSADPSWTAQPAVRDEPAHALFQSRATPSPLAPSSHGTADASAATSINSPIATENATAAIGQSASPQVIPQHPMVGEHPAAIRPGGDPSADSLSRIEAALIDIARSGSTSVTDRFDGVEARLEQMAMQIAELASLARARGRTPAPTALVDARTIVPPADPGQRRAAAVSARDLLARMGEPADHT